MKIRVSDKRGIPAGYVVDGKFFLMDEGPEEIDGFESMETLDFELTVFNLTGKRHAILPDNEAHRTALREHLQDLYAISRKPSVKLPPVAAPAFRIGAYKPASESLFVLCIITQNGLALSPVFRKGEIGYKALLDILEAHPELLHSLYSHKVTIAEILAQ